MRVGKGMLAAAAAIVVFAIAGSSTALGQNCPASPNYSPDFSSSQNCITPNGTPANSGFPGFYGPAFTLTQPTGTSNPAQPAPSGVTTVLRLTPDSGATTGSAWFNTAQPVGSAFSTTFTFQLSGSHPSIDGPADGIAFMIQNSGLNGLGPIGCGLGFGASPEGNCTSAGGIANSLAVEFDTYQNTDIADVSNSHVAIQSCGTGQNSVDALCRLADINLLGLTTNGAPSPINLADGFVHTATVTYLLQATSTQTACFINNTAGPCLDVVLDGTDLFPAGVPVNLGTLLSLTSGDAFVGFTAATGGGDDNQDILSWTFVPQGQTQTVTTNQVTTYQFQNNAYQYLAQLNSGSPTETTITPIYLTAQACDQLVQQTYPNAPTLPHCFVYTGLTPNPDSAVMFEVTCPNLPNDQCNPFSATLATAFTLSTQSGVNMYNPVDPFPGWLKGFGGVNAHPCTPPASGPLFQSDQISSLDIDTKTKGNSGGTGSCWVATYNQPDQIPPPITITSPTNTVYAQNAPVPANYTCSANYKPTSSPVGPYLTVASCTQSTGAQSSCTPTPTGLACTGSVNTSTPGTFNFQVTAMDTGLNTNTQTVSYSVVAPTNLQIANLAPGGPVSNGGSITYLIGVADGGPANADGVIVTDPLPVNTKFVSGSGSNVACSIVNRRLSCTTTQIPCSVVGNNVTCSVGMLAPLSISSLNGGLIAIKVQVTAQPTTTCGTGKKVTPCTINTATVSAINTDTNKNPTGTAQTIW